MRGRSGRLERAIELALASGLLASGALLVLGLALRDAAALHAGIVILMFTPVARVVIVAAGMLLEHDWIFAAVSLWILGVLLSSLRVAHLW